jgi:hypothetical protein
MKPEEEKETIVLASENRVVLDGDMQLYVRRNH